MQNSKIEWTDHTHNVVWGCQRVSPGCEHCYAETWAKRHGHDIWGPAKTTPRRVLSDAYWRQPLKWDDAAAASGQRKRVFCGSMCDIFEDHPTTNEQRARLWPLIEATLWLDWLLLTKRPENMTRFAPSSWADGWPDNVWAMTSCEDQQRADQRIPALLRVPARVRGLSCEPLLGPITFRPKAETFQEMLHLMDTGEASQPTMLRGIHWVIVGGESGPGARPMHPDWARSLRDQCQKAGVSFFFKQHGEYVHADDCAVDSHKHASLFCAGGTAPTVTLYKVGKKAAGRLLDGRTWDEFPEVEQVLR